MTNELPSEITVRLDEKGNVLETRACLKMKIC